MFIEIKTRNINFTHVGGLHWEFLDVIIVQQFLYRDFDQFTYFMIGSELRLIVTET